MGLKEKIVNRLPLGEKMKDMKLKAQAIAYVHGVKKIKKEYKKARSNFLVLVMGIRSGQPMPKIIHSCRKFYFDNRKDWKKYLNGSPVEFVELEMVFRRCLENQESLDDANWLEDTWLPLFNELSAKAEIHWGEIMKLNKS